MAKVSLRIYNRDIESLIDQGGVEEAIAHCRHILKTFPKHLETYRLLGKAYLEAKRYPEATDIFQRVLMAAPDDFVSHVGMSIIRDDETKLDEAIWHMERAYDVQSSNAAIKSELQRLYGRRDGVEPPNIRLTRGALAHLYVQGELYSQAIAEIRSVLAEDPNRPDMQILLAKAYFHAGQRVESSEICSALLKRYPYNLDANRLLVEILPGTERAENTQVYRHRVIELDPYTAFVKGSIFQSDEVPDASVNLDRLDWQPGEQIDMAPEWGSSLGIGLAASGSKQDEMPTWLNSAQTASEPTDEPAPASSDGEEIPEWMRQAGWGESTGEAQEGPAPAFDETEEEETPELAQADIPDWVKSMAPPEAAQGQPPASDEQPAEPALPGDVPDWLKEMQPEGATDESAAADSDQSLPDWLGGEETPAAATSGESEESLPDWMSGEETPAASSQPDEAMPDLLGGEQTSTDVSSQPEDELPAWMSGEEKSAPSSQPEETMPDLLGGEQTPAEMSQTEESLPDWMSEEMTPTTSQPEEELPDWLNEEEPAATPPQAEDQQPSTPESAEGVSAQPTSSMGDLGTTSEEQDAAMLWLENLAAKQGARSDELITNPDERTESAPEWVEKAKSMGGEAQPAPAQSAAETPAAAEPPQEEGLPDWLEAEETSSAAAPAEELPDWLNEEETPASQAEASAEGLPNWLSDEQPAAEQPSVPEAAESAPAQPASSMDDLGTTSEEQDAAMLWLESLAAKQGARSDELITNPDERTESAPEWVEKAKSASGQDGETQPAEKAETPAEQSQEASLDETTAWMQELEERESERISGLSKDLEVESPQAAIPEETQPASQDDVPDWLKETEQPAAPTGRAEPPSTDELPAWLSSMDEAEAEQEQPSEAAEQPQPQAESTSDLADWLENLDKSETEAPAEPSSAEPVQPTAAESEAPPASEGELPSWLKGIEAEEAALEPTDEPPTAPQEPQEKVDINTASRLELAELPGIGDLLAQDIIAHRETYGGFSNVEDLLNVAGIGPGTVEELSGMVTFSELPQAPSREPEMPTWVQDETGPEEPPAEPKPTSPAEWKPDPKLTTQESQPPVAEHPAETPAKPSLEPPPGPKRTGSLSPTMDATLGMAQSLLEHGSIHEALEQYARLIKKGRLLDEVIFDLREALYRYPVEVSIWQSLGDAYMRANRLQDALDSYTKAEELLR